MAASRVDLEARLRSVLDRGRWLALPLGSLLALAFAPASHYLLAFACPAALFVLWHGAQPREAAWRGFLFTVGTFLAGTYWLYHSIHLVGQAPVWVALLLMLGLVAIMGAYTAAVGYVGARWVPANGALRWLFLLPALWVLAEWLRGWFLSGFPWLALGYSQLATPLRGFASLLGVYGVSLATATTAGALVALLLGDKRDRIVAAVIVLCVWGTGVALTRIEWTVPRGAPIRAALVQGAVPQAMKWEPGRRAHTMQCTRT